MRKTVMMLLLLLSAVVWGGEPTGYYNDAQGKSGQELLSALHSIIDGHKDNGYDALKDGYKTTDKKPNGNVWDIYSDVPGGTPPYEFQFGNTCGTYKDEGDCYNREHTFPQSWFSKASPMRNDIMHVLPTDGKVNGMRSNYPYGEVSNPSKTSLNGSKLGPNTTPGYSGTVFEPIDEYKGDLARIYFYMAARYYDKIAGWQNNGTADAVLAGNNFPAYDDWFLQLLFKWNKQDPVSQKEIDRNDAVYDYQGNRNPFVDYPEYVCAVWGGDCDSTTTGGGSTGGTTTVDPTADVTINMSTADYQIIVDYVNNHLTNTDAHPDNTDNYYGASAYHGNFDLRDEAHNAKFTSADDAVTEALRDVFLPIKVDSSLLNVDYIVNYSTYDGASGSASKTFHCSATDPIAFTQGAASVEPIDTTSTDSTLVIPGDSINNVPDDTTVVVVPEETALGLDMTFDTGLSPFTVVQVSGATAWNFSSYNNNGYAVINTYDQGANESWLVAPPVNLDTLVNESFSFSLASYNYGKTIANCGAGQFELYYSNVFDGQTIVGADWTRITSLDDAMLGDKKWAWVDLNIDVTAIRGAKVYFAFAHTSDASNGTTWELDNVKLTGDVYTPTALQEKLSAQLQLFPNPAKDVLRFSAAADRVEVLNLSGNAMLQIAAVSAGQSIDISTLKQGIYLVKVSQGEDRAILRLIKE